MLLLLLFYVQRSTEEEEDIERIVANVKATSKRGNLLSVVSVSILELHGKKSCLRAFRPRLTQTGLYSHTKWLET